MRNSIPNIMLYSKHMALMCLSFLIGLIPLACFSQFSTEKIFFLKYNQVSLCSNESGSVIESKKEVGSFIINMKDKSIIRIKDNSSEVETFSYSDMILRKEDGYLDFPLKDNNRISISLDQKSLYIYMPNTGLLRIYTLPKSK